MLRKAEKHSTDGKLAPNWDSPFRFYESLGNGAYRLVELSGKKFLALGVRQSYGGTIVKFAQATLILV